MKFTLVLNVVDIQVDIGTFLQLLSSMIILSLLVK